MRALTRLGSGCAHEQTHTKAVVAVAWTPDEAHLLSCGYPEETMSWTPV